MLLNITFNGFSFENTLSSIDLRKTFKRSTIYKKDSFVPCKNKYLKKLKNKLIFIETKDITQYIFKAISNDKSLCNEVDNEAYVLLTYKYKNYIVSREVKYLKDSIECREWCVTTIKKFLHDETNIKFESDKLTKYEIEAINKIKEYENNTIKYNNELSKYKNEEPSKLADIIEYYFTKKENYILFIYDILNKLTFKEIMNLLFYIDGNESSIQLILDVDLKTFDIIRNNSFIVNPDCIYFIRYSGDLTCVDEFEGSLSVFRRHTSVIIHS